MSNPPQGYPPQGGYQPQGYPQQQGGYPQQQGGYPQQQGYQPQAYPPGPSGPYQANVPQTNGMATAGLVLGILPTGIIGLIFSILGLNRAKQLGGLGRTKALVGLILSIIWIIASIPVGIAVANNVSKRLDPACVSAEGYGQTIQDKVQADQNNPDAIKQDLQDAVTHLRSDATKTSNAATAAAINKLADDFQELLTDINNGTAPAADLIDRLGADGTAVDTACGR